jgi:hypothetical protein
VWYNNIIPFEGLVKMIVRKDGRTDFKIVSHNEKTGLFGVVWNGDSQYVNIYKVSDKPVSILSPEWTAMRVGCKVGEENRVMYKYGKSKTVHWSTKCAKPNTDATPSEIGLLDAILSGHKECGNCWNRTKGH